MKMKTKNEETAVETGKYGPVYRQNQTVRKKYLKAKHSD